jgi:hypothetical protein
MEIPGTPWALKEQVIRPKPELRSWWWSWNQKRRDHLWDRGGDGRIILKWILRKWKRWCGVDSCWFGYGPLACSFVNSAMMLRVTEQTAKFLTRWATIIVWRRTPLHGVTKGIPREVLHCNVVITPRGILLTFICLIATKLIRNKATNYSLYLFKYTLYLEIFEIIIINHNYIVLYIRSFLKIWSKFNTAFT